MNVNETATDVRVERIFNGLMVKLGMWDVWLWYDDAAQVQHVRLPLFKSTKLQWQNIPAEVRNALVSKG